MWRLGYGVVVVAVLGGGLLSACATRGPSAGVSSVGGGIVHRWVGAGEQFASLLEALGAPIPDGAEVIVNVRAGTYEGPFLVPPRVTLKGHGAAVLHAPNEAPEVVRLQEGSALEDLRVQGGTIGVRVQGARAAIRRVMLNGQHETGILLEEDALGFEGIDLEIDGTNSGIGATGVRLKAGAGAELVRPHFRGAFDAGLRLEPGARGRIAEGRSEGPAHGIRSNGAELEVNGFIALGGRAAGIALGGGRARLRRVQVTGHEYALLAGGGAEVTVDGMASVGAALAGVGIAASSATLSDVLVLESGPHGAVNAVGSQLALSRFLLQGGRGYGLNLHGGASEISHGSIRGISDDGGGGGDGVHVRVGEARIAHVHLSDLAGVGVLAAQGATVEVRDVTVLRATWAGLLAETEARLDVRSVIVQRSSGAAVAVPGEAEVSVDALVAKQNAQGTFWIQCGEGAQLRLGRVRARVHAKDEAQQSPLELPCVQPLGPP